MVAAARGPGREAGRVAGAALVAGGGTRRGLRRLSARVRAQKFYKWPPPPPPMMKRALPPPSFPRVSRALRAPAPPPPPQTGVTRWPAALDLVPAGVVSAPAALQGPARLDRPGTRSRPLEGGGRRLLSGGVGGAPGALTGRGECRGPADCRGPDKGSAGLRGPEETGGGARSAGWGGGPAGARGVGEAPTLVKGNGASAPLPTRSGRFTESVSACLHSSKTWALSSGDGSETCRGSVCVQD